MINDDESLVRLSIAREQQKLLNLIFNNLNDDTFNINLNFDGIDSQSLQNFWIYTSGFLGMQNYEKSDDYSDKEIEEIINGKFIIKDFNKSDSLTFARSLGLSVSKNDMPSRLELFKIQDASYYLDKNKENKMYQLKLTSSPLQLEESEELKQVKPNILFKHLRNVIVHETPVHNEDNRELLFPDDGKIIHVPNMWLRGYSELFASKFANKHTSEIHDILMKGINDSHNISNDTELNSALSLLKDYFGEDSKKNFFRINNYVKLRTQYFNDFYSKPLDEQIDLISQILANNPVYISNGYGSTNPMIIYNLQQIISNEINQRDSQTIQSLFLDYLDRPIIDVLSNFIESYYKHNIPKTATVYDFLDIIENEFLNKNIINQMLNCDNEKIDAIKSSLKGYIKSIRKKDKTGMKFSDFIYKKSAKELKQYLAAESSMMKMFNPETLKTMPVEVAINTVALLAYNNLVTSGFYEDVISGVNFDYLSAAEKEIMSKLNLIDLDCSTIKRSNKKQPYNNSQTAFMLSVMRHALCHGEVVYKLPSKNKNGDKSFGDAVICFYANGKNGDSNNLTEVKGTVDALYKLFNSSVFLSNKEKLHRERCAILSPEKLALAQQLLTQAQKNIQSNLKDNFSNYNEINSPEK